MSDKKLSLIQKTPEELQEYIDAQQKVLTQLNKKIQKLESENIQLKIQLEKTSQSLPAEKRIENENSEISDEESIARKQLALLREVSFQRELSYEECKKVDTYTKLLIALENKKIERPNPLEEMTDAELKQLLNKTDGK